MNFFPLTLKYLFISYSLWKPRYWYPSCHERLLWNLDALSVVFWVSPLFPRRFFVSSPAVLLINPFLNSDKAGRSVPAPGRGSLTVAREIPKTFPPLTSPITHVSFPSVALKSHSGSLTNKRSCKTRSRLSRLLGKPLTKSITHQKFLQSYKKPHARRRTHSPHMGCSKEVILTLLLCDELAVWGLTVDDINVLSIHGTCTIANVSFRFTFYH